MFEFKIVREEFHKTFTLENGKLVPQMAPAYTFHVSDDKGESWMPSLKWYPECNVEGQPKTYYIDRCIRRLQSGHSREAFGGGISPQLNGVAVQSSSKGRARVEKEEGEIEVEMVTSHGGETKPREKRKGFVAFVDGQQLGDAFPTEIAARGAAAVYAFMTRGKMGRLHYVRERLASLTSSPPEDCKVWVCGEKNTIRAKVKDQEYAIAWVKPGESFSSAEDTDDFEERMQWRVEYFKPMMDTETKEEVKDIAKKDTSQTRQTRRK